MRICATSNLTWVKVNVESRTDGATSPQTAVVASENLKLEVKRKPIGLKSSGWVCGSEIYLKRN